MIDSTIASVLESKGHTIFSVTPDATVYHAIALMAEKGVAAVLVVSQAGNLDGILSTRDYGRKIVLQGRSPKHVPVREVMSRPVISASPEMKVIECLQFMCMNHFRHLPVLDRGRLVGLVSMGDLVNEVVSEQAHMLKHLHSYIGHKYPA